MGKKRGQAGQSAHTASWEYWGKREEVKDTIYFKSIHFCSKVELQCRQMKLLSFNFEIGNGGNTDPFTSDKHSSSLVPSVWLGILPRPSVTFITDCSTLFQAPVDEVSDWYLDRFLKNLFILISLAGITCFTGFPHVDLSEPVILVWVNEAVINLVESHLGPLAEQCRQELCF